MGKHVYAITCARKIFLSFSLSPTVSITYSQFSGFYFSFHISEKCSRNKEIYCESILEILSK